MYDPLAKIILGTAGLGGKSYGRSKRWVAESVVTDLIHFACDEGIKRFDTAPAYGRAEEWLGDALRSYDCGDHVVYTRNNGDQKQAFESIQRLAPAEVHFFWHNWSGQKLPRHVDGVTVYDTKKLASLQRRTVQINWNILRQIELPKAATVHVRSVFLQGVLAGQPCPNKTLAKHVNKACEFAKLHRVTLKELALGSALMRSDIDAVVIGATSQEELQDCLRIAKMASKLEGLAETLSLLDVSNRSLTDPRKWT